MRAVDLAHQLGVDPKRLRQWLRDNYAHEHNAPWILSVEQERAARARFGSGPALTASVPAPAGSVRAPTRNVCGRATATAPSGARGRDTSDEAYVIDLCDEILGQRALRQHRFPWLKGDPSASGASALLPVDAYYSAHRLVVEYRESQHFKPTPFFDRRQTVGGVDRGEQRRIYDQRREQEVPAHGLRLAIIAVSDLPSDGRGRLLRERAADLAAIRAILESGVG